MENTVNDPLFGKLRGHKAPVTDLFRFPSQPFATTIDTSGTVKIWDIRNLLCVQTIVPIRLQEIHQNLTMISPESFLTYGERFKVLQVNRLFDKKAV